MSAQKEYDLKNLTYTENFQIFRNFVVERSNGKDNKEKVFQKHLDQLTIPAFRESLTSYFKESEGAFFKGSKVDILAKHLTKLYEVKSAALTNDPIFSQRIVNDKQFQSAIVDEAKNLHSGTTFFSVDLATREIRQLREDNHKLVSINQKLNTALTNLVSNVKSRFGLQEKEIDQMMNVGEKEKVVTNKLEVNNGQGAGTKKDFNIGM